MGIRQNGNYTVMCAHAFLNFLQTASVSIKQMFFFQSNCGKEASIYGSARTPNAEGFSSSWFSEANWLLK